MAYIERAISKVLKNRVRNSKCTLVVGARQVGKSTLIQHDFSEYHRTTFDDQLTRLQAKEEPKLFFLNNPCPLIIDEVQKEPSVLEEIKQIVDNSQNRGQFILTGSAKLELMKGVSESLAGRVSICELGGLSLREIYQVPFNGHFVPTEQYICEREKELRHYEDIWEIIHKGSYPELYDVDRDWLDFYSSYVATYLERDINGLISADSITFTKFLTAVAARTGEMLNYNNIASEIGVSEPTVKSWISILERTGIIYILQPYSASTLNRAIKTPKIYFRDTGLACYLTKWLTADALKNSAVAGSMFETFVVSEILKSYSNEGRDYQFQIFYYRGKDKSTAGENEIDLIIEENGVLYPVEIKMTGNPKASMGSANSILDKIPGKKRGMGVILCMVSQKTYLRENLVALPIEFI
ncbi:MAG: ATP-binding protein [Lachnospiraceae bacterium]|uniref:ATP-binding protein n=1 Tax=Candidatus Weimeria bifida TaxID=2599074 RepID=A0A6N7IYZ6_9FIRM|nr:ATP-binding protein [Candidatus Weimeria bifida]RRF95362.1 MAG: ATP-binding protein [Lachnospiraceae bacterium]